LDPMTNKFDINSVHWPLFGIVGAQATDGLCWYF
jgi:hypothetical protein